MFDLENLSNFKLLPIFSNFILSDNGIYKKLQLKIAQKPSLFQH